MYNYLEINTNSYYIKYYDIQNDNNIIKEVYRLYYYDKLQNKLYKYINKYLLKVLKKDPNANISDRKIYLTKEFATDIISILIFNHNFNSNDPIFDNKSPFEYNNIYTFFNKDKCLTIYTDKLKQMIFDIIPKIGQKYIKYYKKLKKNYINKYKINYEKIDNNININIEIYNLDPKIIYTKIIDIPIHIFNHLVKLYNIKNLNNYVSNEVLDIKVIEYIYILFIRYFKFSSGNNQASVLPSFKKFLKINLNIKVELFGSPLNTSNANYGSFFYDIDKYFGSLGNFFNMKIKKGYYEINPPFDKCLINKMFIRLNNILIEAEEEKNPILFFIILPKSYIDYNKIDNKYLKINIFLTKDQFPYIRYNRTFKKTIVSPIVDTYILIMYNDYISSFVKNNLNKFNDLLDGWIKKK